MKPLRLSIKGINSFESEQTIDFLELTQYGFFGIFGPTGSGKTSILDAITLALYGAISRESDNYININTDKAHVEFDFQISGTINKVYRVFREFKRTKKTLKPQSGKCKLIDITNGEQILEEGVIALNKRCEKIIGLKKDDFMRTVVLPQGKFNEFLKLKGVDRRNMLERLFNLDEYGDKLSNKVKIALSIVRDSINRLEGEIKYIQNVTEEDINLQEKLVDSLSISYDLSNKEFNEFNEKHKILLEQNFLLYEIEELNKIIFSLRNEILPRNLNYIKSNLNEKLALAEEELKSHRLNRSHLQTQNDKLEELITRLKFEKNQAKLENLAFDLRIKLKNDCSCPVCGSKEHPYIDDEEAGFNLYLQDIRIIEEEIINLESSLKLVEENLISTDKEIFVLIRKIESINCEIENSGMDFMYDSLDYTIKENDKYNLDLCSDETKKKEMNDRLLKYEKILLEKEKQLTFNTIIDFKEKELQLIDEKLVIERNKLQDMENKFSLFKELLQKKHENQTKQKILKKLNDLFAEKKFVEFVSIERLKYITKSASRILLDITGSNYSLHTNDEGIFMIKDNKNGGLTRNISTLSGGETFLVSLALALALSSDTQLKNTVPLELFFLDEGFGTLDDSLLELMMSSLEKINNEKLKIGIISHMDSVKQRVPVKLIVSPAVAGVSGSIIKIEHSY